MLSHAPRDDPARSSSPGLLLWPQEVRGDWSCGWEEVKEGNSLCSQRALEPLCSSTVDGRFAHEDVSLTGESIPYRQHSASKWMKQTEELRCKQWNWRWQPNRSGAASRVSRAKMDHKRSRVAATVDAQERYKVSGGYRANFMKYDSSCRRREMGVEQICSLEEAAKCVKLSEAEQSLKEKGKCGEEDVFAGGSCGTGTELNESPFEQGTLCWRQTQT